MKLKFAFYKKKFYLNLKKKEDFMELGSEYVGTIQEFSCERWEETSKNCNKKYIFLNNNNEIYFCNDMKHFGELKTINQIAEIIKQKETSQSEALWEQRKITEETLEYSDAAKEDLLAILEGKGEFQIPEDLLAILEKNEAPQIDDQIQLLINKSEELLVNKMPQSDERELFFQSLDYLHGAFKSEKIYETPGKSYVDVVQELSPLVRSLFERLSPQESKYSEFLIALEQAKQSLLNNHLFKTQVQRFINQNKDVLLKEMVNSQLINCVEDFKELEIQISPLSELLETHNTGKFPLLLVFKGEKDVEKKVVLKPRDGAIDRDIISLCKKISCNEEFKEMLPNYSILSINQNSQIWNWDSCSFLGGFSLWEYIDGSNLRELGCSIAEAVESCIRTSCNWLNETEKNKILTKTTAMMSLFNQIHLGDLHVENFMLKGVKIKSNVSKRALSLTRNNMYKLKKNQLQIDQNQLDIVPIDLECANLCNKIRNRDDTFSEKIKSNNNIKDLIKEFNDSIEEKPSRLIVLGTQEISYMTSEFSSLDLTVEKITQKLKENFNSININKISELLKISFLNRDVPYFTIFRGKVYYGGEITESCLIAESPLK